METCATRPYLKLMDGAGKMSKQEFSQGLAAYEKKYFQQKLPDK
jgi:hypothetical protein